MAAPEPAPEHSPDDPLPRSVEWCGDHVRLIDQRRLPEHLVMVDLTTADEVADAIADLTVRGAPAIGAAAAFGVALAVVAGEDPHAAGARLKAARPTAVNLAWAVERVLAAADPVAEAVRLADEDVEINRAIGAHGAALVPAGANVLTHCNAGGLATVGYGTAIGVVRAAHEPGSDPHVWVDETRPVLQGARLTAWELQRLGIRATLVPDVMAGSLMASGDVDLVIVGADRIAANGDVANKIGTYGLAVLAHHHGLPFYVAAPCSTHDPATARGADIRIERRSPEEVTTLAGRRVAPDGFAAENRAFDVTPAALVTAYISERGVDRRPSSRSAPDGTTPADASGRRRAPPGIAASGRASLSHPLRRFPGHGVPHARTLRRRAVERAGGSARAASPGCAHRPPPVRRPGSTAACSLFVYEGVARRLVAGLKFANRRGALGVLGAALAAGAAPELVASAGVVTWPPASTARRRRRGLRPGRAAGEGRRPGCRAAGPAVAAP